MKKSEQRAELKEEVGKYICLNWKRFGVHPMGHAFIWADVMGAKMCVGSVPGCKDLWSLCHALEEEFEFVTNVYYNLD